ncbi:MAG: beta-lactamase family protein [Spirochaetia bacterium]|nr:beta-lactamase family protein [Spirochaetia bacterium]
MDTEKNIDKLFARWQSGNCPGGQVLVRKAGKTIYRKWFGMANLEYQVPINSQTLFHLASVSKQFTVMAILLLQEAHKLQVDDDIRKYVGDIIHIPVAITIRNLMNNTSGIRDQWELLMLRGVRIDDVITMQDVLATLSDQRNLNFTPGSRYLYSNSNFTLLAEIVNRVSGMPFPEFLRQKVFIPLGMNQTCVRNEVTQVLKNVAYSYIDRGNGKFAYQPLNFCLYGPTSVNSTVDDFVSVLDYYEGQLSSFGSQASRNFMFTRPILSNGLPSEYGAGLEFGSHKGLEFFGHGGVDAGFRSQILIFPKEHLDICIFSNTTNIAPKQAALRIADILLELPQEQSIESGKDLKEAMVGTYVNNDKDRPCQLTISENGKENFVEKNGYRIALHRLPDGSYQLGTLDAYISFCDSKALYKAAGRTYDLDKVLPAKELDGLEGTYTDTENSAVLQISQQGQEYIISRFRWPAAKLYQRSQDVLCFDVFDDLPSSLTLIRKEHAITGFSLDCGRSLHMIFQKQ